MTTVKFFAITTFLLFSSPSIFSQSIKMIDNQDIYCNYIDSLNNQQLKAITLLNYYTFTLSKISSLDSKIMLREEYEDINNNLSIESIVGYDEIKQLRVTMMKELNSFIINDEEKRRALRLEEKKIKDAGREAVLGALSGVNVTINPYSAIANTIIGAARATLDHSLRVDALKQQTDDIFWQIQKENMIRLTELRTFYINQAFALFSKYSLPERARLTENTANELANINKELRIAIRLQRLIDNKKKYESFAPFWYYLGDAYIQNGHIQEGLKCFNIYEDLYAKSPVYRINKILGQIALQRLANSKKLSIEEREDLIEVIEEHLFDNSDALLYCACNYIANNQIAKAIMFIRRCLTNPMMNSKEDGLLLLMELCKNNETIKINFEQDLKIITEAIQDIEEINFDVYLAYFSMTDSLNPTFWNKMNEISLDLEIDKDWFGTDDCDGVKINIPKSLGIDCNELNFYAVSFEDDNTKIDSYSIVASDSDIYKFKKIKKEFASLLAKDKNDNYIDLNKIFDKVDEGRYRFKTKIEWDDLSENVGETDKEKLKNKHIEFASDQKFHYLLNDDSRIECELSDVFFAKLNHNLKNDSYGKLDFLDSDKTNILILENGNINIIFGITKEYYRVELLAISQNNTIVYNPQKSVTQGEPNLWKSIIIDKFENWYEKTYK